ncbi:hypothetical protein D9M68_814230 [compost metagenome]
MGRQLTPFGQCLVDRQDTDGLVVHLASGYLVGDGLHPAGDAETLVVIQRYPAAGHQLRLGGRRQQLLRRVEAGVHQEAVGPAIRVMADGGQFLILQRFHLRGVDSGALEHGCVRPAGMQVPADEEDRQVRPLALVEALFELLNLAPVG